MGAVLTPRRISRTPGSPGAARAQRLRATLSRLQREGLRVAERLYIDAAPKSTADFRRINAELDRIERHIRDAREVLVG